MKNKTTFTTILRYTAGVPVFVIGAGFLGIRFVADLGINATLYLLEQLGL